MSPGLRYTDVRLATNGVDKQRCQIEPKMKQTVTE